jgi:hypothetical protein
MHTHRLLTLALDDEPIWVWLYVQRIEARWVAMLVADGVTPPGPGEVKGLTFFGETVEDAERGAKTYLGQGEAVN